MHRDSHGTATRVLPPQATSARTARQFVGEVLQEWSLPQDFAETAQLLTSELVSNVVLHACTDFKVHVTPHGKGRVRVCVIDDSTRRVVRRATDHDAMTGRGLLLVEALSAAWGVDPVDGGKAVWFLLEQDD